MPAPALDDDLCLAESVEDLGVEQLVPEPGIEALDIAILPGASLIQLPGTALAMNSGQVSERMWRGTPRRMNKSEALLQAFKVSDQSPLDLA